MPLEIYIPLIVSPVVLGLFIAYIRAERVMTDAFGGGHIQTAFDPVTGAVIGVGGDGAGKILYEGRLYDFHVSGARAASCRPGGLWRLVSALLGSGFSRWELHLPQKAQGFPEKISRPAVAFCSQAAKENFFRAFAPALLKAESPQKKNGEHRREAAALPRIARRNGRRRTRARRVKGFGRIVEELACLFDPAASDFPQAAGGKRGVSAVRKIYVRVIGELYPGYSAETIDTYLRAHFEEVWKSGKPCLRPETKG